MRLAKELFPRVDFIVTNLPMDPDWVVRFYNQRGTAEQHIKKGKYAFRWTRLSCKRFRDDEVRLNCIRWPTTWPRSCAASSCPRPWPTGR